MTRFLYPPTIPAPTADLHAATKKYVDDKHDVPNLPAIRISNSTDQSISSGSVTDFDFNQQDYSRGPSGYLSSSLASGTITIGTSGIYLVILAVRIYQSSSGQIRLYTYSDSDIISHGAWTGLGATTSHNISVVREFTSGEVIKGAVWQNDGTSRDSKSLWEAPHLTVTGLSL